ncbi:MAG: GntR family transcriptional regulator [Beijerinckiaceae bacterium]
MGVIGKTRAALDKSKASPRAAALVYAQLRQEIIALRLEPGHVVNRAQLQERFGFSSTPVRDALMRLGEEGLVEIVAQSATRVSLIDIGLARQAQFLRRALEQEAVETLCLSADRAVVQELIALIKEQRIIATKGDLALFDTVDREFHRRIFEAAGVAELHEMVSRRSGHIERIRQLHLPQAGRMQEIIDDHEVIVSAIKAGDAQAARSAIRNHLSRSLAYSPRLRELHPHAFKA